MNLSSCCHPYSFLLFSSSVVSACAFLYICPSVIWIFWNRPVYLLLIFSHTFKITPSIIIFPSSFSFYDPLFIPVTACVCLISIFYFLSLLFFPISPSFICTVLFLYLFLEENPSNAHKAFEASYLRTKMPNWISKTTRNTSWKMRK